MEESAVAAHTAIRAQGSGNFRRSRVHQEKLKQKAGTDDERSAPAGGQQLLIVTLTCGWCLCAGFFTSVGTFGFTALCAGLFGVVARVTASAAAAVGKGR